MRHPFAVMTRTYFAQETVLRGFLWSLIMTVTGCSTITLGPGESLIHKSPKGTVHLLPITDQSFVAEHPAVIDHATFLTVLQGLTAEPLVHSSTMPADGDTLMRVFSDEDAEFLAPLLADGLSRAKPTQTVGFTVSPSAGSGAEPAAGIIYRHHNALHVLLSTPSGRKLSGFRPRVAARIERAPAYTKNWTPGTHVAVINLERLHPPQWSSVSPSLGTNLGPARQLLPKEQPDTRP
ncbi:MAG: hypothetical protein NNA23_10840 [Nitrospira sp.]|nr:hypothetical protein [Nitrospira sp.]